MIKSRILRAAAAVMLIITMLCCVSGCGRDKKMAEVETVKGVWTSNDGFSLTLTENTLSLTDNNGENCLPYDCLNYVWTDDTLYVNIEGQQFGIFDVYLNEDTMTLTYVAGVMGISDSDVTSITLTRSN